MNVLVVLIPVAAVVSGGIALLRRVIARQLERQGHRPSQLPPDVDPGHRFVPDRSVTFRGGARVGTGNASIPLVTLRADEQWAQTSGAGLTFGGVPPVWIDRAVVTAVRAIDVPTSPGVRFDSTDGRYDGVVFWTYGRTAVLAALHGLGWPVADSPVGQAADQPEVSS